MYESPQVEIYVTDKKAKKQQSEELKRQLKVLEGSLKVSYGRPNFDQIFSDAKSTHINETVGVFFCGPPTLGNMIRTYCDNYSSGFGTSFKYREEHF